MPLEARNIRPGDIIDGNVVLDVAYDGPQVVIRIEPVGIMRLARRRPVYVHRDNDIALPVERVARRIFDEGDTDA